MKIVYSYFLLFERSMSDSIDGSALASLDASGEPTDPASPPSAPSSPPTAKSKPTTERQRSKSPTEKGKVTSDDSNAGDAAEEIGKSS